MCSSFTEQHFTEQSVGVKDEEGAKEKSCEQNVSLKCVEIEDGDQIAMTWLQAIFQEE